MAENLNQEQAAPADGTGPDCWELVLADMRDRRQMGIDKYGKPLRSDNGRDALVDAYQEALDLTVYLRQAIEQGRSAEMNKPIPSKAEIIDTMNAISMVAYVRWDRCVERPEGGGVVYGWIARMDGRHDFVCLYWGPGGFGQTNSSPLYSRLISRAIFGDDEGHEDCQTVETVFGEGVHFRARDKSRSVGGQLVWAVEFFCLYDRTGRVLGLFATEERAKAFAEEQRRTTVCPQEDFVWQVRRVEVQS
jgi:hypothetical protein